MGNRIAKLIKDGNDSLIKATYYVRDAQGNVMTVYQWQINDTTTWPEHIAAERYIYGSSRLGVETTPVEMIGAMPQTQDTAVRFLQYKHYEISNHLGNVLAVVSDKKVLKDTNSDLVVDEYHPDILSANDYSPFGVYLYGRTWSAKEYRYGFNGMEKDDEVKGSGNSLDFGARLYDSRLGRWLSVDAMVAKYPYLNPYNFGANNPTVFIDIDGRDITACNDAARQVIGQAVQNVFKSTDVFTVNDKGLVVINKKAYRHAKKNLWDSNQKELAKDFKSVVKSKDFHLRVFSGKGKEKFVDEVHEEKTTILTDVHGNKSVKTVNPSPLKFEGKTDYASTAINDDEHYSNFGWVLINEEGLNNFLPDEVAKKEGVDCFSVTATFFHEVLDHFQNYMLTGEQEPTGTPKEQVKNYNKAAKAEGSKERTGESH